MLMKRAGSMWLTNFQVALISCFSALVGCFVNDGAAIRQDGFFRGYSVLVWVVILLQAGGGLVIASVMKYADNILKCFGSALSISIGCVISIYMLREVAATVNFYVGTLLVILASCLYGVPKAQIVALLGGDGENKKQS